MGSISTGIGLISGIDTATLINGLLAIEARIKRPLENRLTSLQTQQAAMLDINARLLNLKNASTAFRLSSVFDAALAASSNENVLTATASDAQPGTHTFIVKQLVSTSRKVSKGFADADTSPVGLTSLSFEIGNGSLATDEELANLNGGAGVRRGRIIITDSNSNISTINLSKATTVNEVLDAINDDTTVSVTAAVVGDHLEITDTGGGAGTLVIANASGDFTATDLGIAKTAVGATITGDDVNYLSGDTALSSLNDGTGVLIRDASPDLTIIARNGRQFDVDLGRIDNPVTGSTLLEDLAGGGITLNDDSDDPDIKFITRDGTEYEVDLTGLTTVQAVINKIDSETGGHIALSVHADGNKLTVTDTVGGGGNLRVLGAGENGEDTAEDLGILNATGAPADTFDGSVVQNADHTPAVRTIQDVIDRINSAKDTTDVDNGGDIVASIGADGVSLRIDDTTGASANNLVITSTITNPYAARDLGIDTGAEGITSAIVSGDHLIAGLNSVLLKSLDGGSGVSGLAPGLNPDTLIEDFFFGTGISTTGDFQPDMRMRDRADNPWVNLDLDAMTTVQDLIDAVEAGSGGTMTLEIKGTALQANDHTGSMAFDFRIQNLNGTTTADDLGLAGSYAADTVLGIGLSPLPTRTFRVTDRTGAFADINLVNPKSLSEVIDEINNAGIGVVASLNDAGNGLLLTDTTGSTASNLVVSDTRGTLATELGIAGSVAADSIRGTNLQLRYVAEATAVEDLNFGRGIGTGSFLLTDGDGQNTTINIGSDAKTLYDIINEINGQASAASLDITARVNDTGDGLYLENTLGSGIIRVDPISGSVADDLRIAGAAAADGEDIDGSYEVAITVNASDTVEEIVSAINDADVPVTASILNTGAGPTPYQITFASDITGLPGELFIDDGGFGLNVKTLSEARNAQAFYGSEDPADGILIERSTNSISDVVPGVTLDLVSASDDPVTVTVTRDTDTIIEDVEHFVTTFNDAIGRIDQYDFYNAETETRGPLLGDGTTGRIRNALFRTVLGRATGVSTKYTRLSDVGIKVGSGGVLSFDRSVFLDAYEEDAEAVENLFTAFKGTTTTTTEIAPGVTTTTSDQTFTQLGFGDLFDQLLGNLTNSVNGALTLADRARRDQIEFTERRLEQFDERLEVKRARLERQFAAMETALARLQEQNASILSLSGNLAITQQQLAG